MLETPLQKLKMYLKNHKLSRVVLLVVSGGGYYGFWWSLEMKKIDDIHLLSKLDIFLFLNESD